jgi:Na+-transporting NADH:ubiquinone oxidoreductase subunit C
MIVALSVSLVGSILVASSAVLLKPLQTANREHERSQKYIVEMIDSLPRAAEPAAGRLEIEARVVDLATGSYVASIDPATYDQRAAARDPLRGVEIPPERDIAGIKRRAKLATVHLAKEDGRLKLVILPVHGKGFQSTLYGYLGLSGDTETVAGLVFYEHGETPGLGALVDSPKWRQKWTGKNLWDDLGNPALAVVMGGIDPTMPAARHQVDGLTGATWTSRGVTNLLRFWLGDDGFGPYLRKIRRTGE